MKRTFLIVALVLAAFIAAGFFDDCSAEAAVAPITTSVPGENGSPYVMCDGYFASVSWTIAIGGYVYRCVNDGTWCAPCAWNPTLGYGSPWWAYGIGYTTNARSPRPYYRLVAIY